MATANPDHKPTPLMVARGERDAARAELDITLRTLSAMAERAGPDAMATCDLDGKGSTLTAKAYRFRHALPSVVRTYRWAGASSAGTVVSTLQDWSEEANRRASMGSEEAHAEARAIDQLRTALADLEA